LNEKAQSPNGRWMRIFIGSRTRVTLIRAVVIGALCFVVLKFWLRPAWVDGHSMDPTIRDRQIRVINLMAYSNSRPARFDIVAIKAGSGRYYLLKRVVGLPGESVEWTQGNLQINGEKTDEPYLAGPIDWEIPVEELGPREYYVAGDNRTYSLENQVYGSVHRRQIKGKLLW